MRLCLQSTVSTPAVGVHVVGKDRDHVALQQVLEQNLEVNHISKAHWQNEKTVALVVDGASVLLQSMGRELATIIPGLFVLYCCAHRIQRIDGAITSPPKNDVITPGQQKVKKQAMRMDKLLWSWVQSLHGTNFYDIALGSKPVWHRSALPVALHCLLFTTFAGTYIGVVGDTLPSKGADCSG